MKGGKEVGKWRKQLERPKSSCLSRDKKLIGERDRNAVSRKLSLLCPDMTIMIFQH